MVKRGFSLAEALIVMAILAIFFGFAGKVITTKPKPKLSISPHGYYECYHDGTRYLQRYVLEDNESEPLVVTTCEFVPKVGSALYNIHAIFAYDYIYSNVEPNINDSITIMFLASKGEMKIGDMLLENNMKIEQLLNYLSVSYPRSGLYNGGAVRRGIIISW